VLLFVLVGIGLFIYWHRPSIDLIGWLHEDIGRYFVVCFLSSSNSNRRFPCTQSFSLSPLF